MTKMHEGEGRQSAEIGLPESDPVLAAAGMRFVDLNASLCRCGWRYSHPVDAVRREKARKHLRKCRVTSPESGKS